MRKNPLLSYTRTLCNIKNHSIEIILFETKRLIIREVIESDIDGFYKLYSSKKVMDSIPIETLNFKESKEANKKKFLKINITQIMESGIP